MYGIYFLKTLNIFFSKGGGGGWCSLTFSNRILSLVLPNFEGLRNIKQMVVQSKFYVDSIRNGGLKRSEV